MNIMKRYRVICWVGLVLAGSVWQATQAQTADSPQTVEVQQRLGEFADLDRPFLDEDGEEKNLKELIDRPTVLTLVYYRCPGICTPVLQGLARSIALAKVAPGEDYQLLTISFDHREREMPELAKNKKGAMLRHAKGEYDFEIPAEAWTFMTGNEEDIRALAESVGFPFVPDGEDFTHPGVVIFLSREGKIVRYLEGLGTSSFMGKYEKPGFVPAEFDLAVIDANAGRPGMVLKKFQRLCFTYDEEQGRYMLQANRIVLAVGVLTMAAMGGFLFIQSRRKISKETASLQSGAEHNNVEA